MLFRCHAAHDSSRNRTIVLVVVAAAALLAPSAATALTWEMIALPDTQYYSADTYSFDGNNKWHTYPSGTLSAIVNAQTQWIVNRRSAENIVFVTHLGDVVDYRDDANQWKRATSAMNTIKVNAPGLPYSVSMGNHDYRWWGVLGSNTTKFTSYFGPARYAGNAWYPAANNGYNGVDHYQVFTVGGYEFLNLNLRYAPSSSDIAWAQRVINSNPGKSVILSTHDYLTASGTRSSNGEYIWQNLVRQNPQLFLVLSGHDYGSGSNPGARRLTSLDNAGQTVLQVLSDYQNLPYGGDGYLRKMIFDSGSGGVGSLTFQTYSPTRNAYRAGSQEAFSYGVIFDSLVHIGAPLATLWPTGAVAVPEPGTWALLMAGALCLLPLIRRQRVQRPSSGRQDPCRMTLRLVGGRWGGYSCLPRSGQARMAVPPAFSLLHKTLSWFTVNWKVGARIVQSQEEVRVPLLCSRNCLSQCDLTSLRIEKRNPY